MHYQCKKFTHTPTTSYHIDNFEDILNTTIAK